MRGCAIRRRAEEILQAANRLGRSLSCVSAAGTSAQRNVRRDKRDGEFSAGQQHGEILHAAALGEEFVWPGKRNPISYMRALWIGPVTTASISPRSASATASSKRSAAARAVSGVGSPVTNTSDTLPMTDVFESHVGQSPGTQRSPNDLRTDAGGIAQGNADAMIAVMHVTMPQSSSSTSAITSRLDVALAID